MLPIFKIHGNLLVVYRRMHRYKKLHGLTSDPSCENRDIPTFTLFPESEALNWCLFH